MSVYVSHISACWYWRNAGDFPTTLANRGNGCWDDDRPITPTELDFLLNSGLFGETPVHLLVPSAMHRFQRAKCSYHVCTKKLPDDPFCDVGGGVFVTSPELMLAQLAQQSSPFQFVETCMEFMGTYALRDDGIRGFATRQIPLVTQERILPALKKLLGRDSFRKARLVLEHAAQGSRSPMETREYLLLFLPKKYGGYGLPKAKMNARIALLPEQQAETGREYIECDLLWPEHRVAVEYDGEHDHASHESRARDATKRNVLQTCGIRQFTVTARQMLDKAAFDAVARNIARSIGYKMKCFPDDWDERREFLRHDLFGSMKGRR